MDFSKPRSALKSIIIEIKKIGDGDWSEVICRKAYAAIS